MKTTLNQEAKITIIKLEGEIDANTAPEIRAKVSPLTQPKSEILLDLTHVTYMSSSGLRMLLSLYRKAVDLDVNLALFGLSAELQDTLAVVGFLDFFPTYRNLDSAIAALKSGKRVVARLRDHSDQFTKPIH